MIDGAARIDAVAPTPAPGDDCRWAVAFRMVDMRREGSLARLKETHQA